MSKSPKDSVQVCSSLLHEAITVRQAGRGLASLLLHQLAGGGGGGAAPRGAECPAANAFITRKAETTLLSASAVVP